MTEHGVARQKRNMDWGFPRWRAYGQDRSAARVRLCDHEGCTQPGDHPAPKSAFSSQERWWFCQDHAAEYNRQWDYFAGLSDEEAARRAAADSQEANGYRQASHWTWSGPGDGAGISRAEHDALRVLELEPGATPAQVKASYRRLAKRHHPDANPGDARAAERFQAVRVAYDLLRRKPVPPG